MKFMKLGSRPDTFYTSDSVRSVSSEVSNDFIVQVEGNRYFLHKFPLLSKCLHLRRLCSDKNHEIVQLPDFPGGIDAFELCAKFCYGITITLSAYNIVSARCASEYLQMTEDVEKGNLIYKIEVFFNSCILQGWKDSIVALQSTKSFPSWSEDLRLTSKCIETIAAKITANHSRINFSHSDKGWWAEDVRELNIDLYWRIIIAIKSSGKIPSSLIADALRIYATRWLPILSKDFNVNKRVDYEVGFDSDGGDSSSKYRLLLESIISLLPAEKGVVSCSFLLKLLKAGNMVNASYSSKMELSRRVGIQLDEAKVSDLLIPTKGSSTVYDVDAVMTMLEQFVLQGLSPPTSPVRVKNGFDSRRRSRSAEKIDFDFHESRRSSSTSHSAKLKVGKLVDGYLQEIARDVNLPVSKFIAVAEAVPDFARIDHDDLYRGIDIYLKAHPNLTKSERKRLCRILDCKKLSMEACTHAAQNELLPLRVVIQVLFFDQARAVTADGPVTDLPSNIKVVFAQNADSRKPTSSLSTNAANVLPSITGLDSPKSKVSTLRMKLAEEDLDNSYVDRIENNSKVKAKAICSFPGGPKKVLSKLWSINRSACKRN